MRISTNPEYTNPLPDEELSNTLNQETQTETLVVKEQIINKEIDSENSSDNSTDPEISTTPSEPSQIVSGPQTKVEQKKDNTEEQAEVNSIADNNNAISDKAIRSDQAENGVNQIKISNDEGNTEVSQNSISNTQDETSDSNEITIANSDVEISETQEDKVVEIACNESA